MTAVPTESGPMLSARIDKLTQALLYVATELWASQDRQAVLERLLADEGVSAPLLIDSYPLESALAAKLATQREGFVSSILGFLSPDAGHEER